MPVDAWAVAHGGGLGRCAFIFYQSCNNFPPAVRTWGFSLDPRAPLQPVPGQYNENLFQAMDFVIAEVSPLWNIYFIFE